MLAFLLLAVYPGRSWGQSTERIGTVLATDGVALDSFGGTLLDLEPDDLAYVGMAAAKGLGTTDWRSLDPREITV